MERSIVGRSLVAAFAVTLVASANAVAGSKFQTTLVPNVGGTSPGFSASGSSMFIDGHRALKGKIKKVVDGDGNLVSTDGMAASGDEYTIEVDLAVAATLTSGTVVVPVEIKKGNGKFSADIASDPVLAGAVLGNGVAVTGVRVKDSVGTVLGVGGFAIE